MQIKSTGLVACISVVGALLFDVCGLPVPWMLGPLFAVLISQFFINYKLYWPVKLRNFGLIIVGISIGQSFQLGLLKAMGWELFYMLVLNIGLVIISVVMALGVMKYGGLSLKTALTCTVPGGLAQIVVFAEEEKNIDLAVVTFFHVVRVISIVFLVPFFLSGHVLQASGESGVSVKTLIPLVLLISCSFAMVWVGKWIRLPVPFFLSPVLFVIILKIFSVDIPEVPGELLHIAQLFMGAYIGLLLKPDMVKLENRTLLLGVASALILLVVTFAQGLILVHFLDYSLSTSFLSTAAGGLDQMSLLATAVGADVSVVTVFQIFRLLFVFIIVLPALKYACASIDRISENGKLSKSRPTK